MTKGNKGIDRLIDKFENQRRRKKVFGYRKKRDTKIREVGDQWEEVNPVTGQVWLWTQKEGYRVKQAKGMSGMREAIDNLYKCISPDCTTEYMTSFDKKMQKISGMCADCHFKFEIKRSIPLFPLLQLI